ncbi:MAG: tetratricopeptide repeat protein [Acidobacteriota bacterium]
MVATAFLLISCGAAKEPDAARLATDNAATAELNRVNAILASNGPITRADLDSLVKLREQYPNAAPVRQILQGAFIKREDWAAAEKIIADTRDNERTNSDRLNLAKIYFKQGKFSECADLLKAMPPNADEHVEILALLGQSEFYRGNLDEAGKSFESVLGDLVSQKRADDISLLGTIYFRRGDQAKAIETLQNAVEISPENISANSALSRAYAASGDDIRAEAIRKKLKSINIRVAAEEKRKSRVIPLFYKLEDAYAAKDFEKVVALVEQIQPDADDATKPTLYRYLAAAYQAQGKQTEANNALAEAAKLTQK